MVPGAREPGGGEKVTLAADRAERRARTIIRAITFDVGGTLLEPWPSVGQVYARVAARLGWGELDPTLLNQRFREAWQRRPAFDYSRAAWAALAEETFAGLGQTWTGDFFTALYDAFAEPEVWRVFDDVRPALEALRRLGLQLAVVSNWDERLRPLLRRLELDDCFESLVISCEAGFTKPAPEIFQRALTELRLPAASVLHVGDRQREDVAGAQAAGLQAVLLDRACASALPERIRSLTELAPWVQATA